MTNSVQRPASSSSSPATVRACRIGIDIGGTFTDGAIVDEATGKVRNVKVLTTPRAPAEGFMTAVDHAPWKSVRLGLNPPLLCSFTLRRSRQMH